MSVTVGEHWVIINQKVQHSLQTSYTGLLVTTGMLWMQEDVKHWKNCILSDLATRLLTDILSLPFTMSKTFSQFGPPTWASLPP